MQPIVDFDAADKCSLSIATLKAVNFHFDILPIPRDSFKDH